MLRVLLRKSLLQFCCVIVAGFLYAQLATSSLLADTSDNSTQENTTRSYTVETQQVHPNGVILRVSQVTLAKLHTTIHASVVNGANSPIALNHWYRTDPTVLLDAQGNAYRLTAPQGDEEIQVPPGHSLEGTFVFLGQIPTSSPTLTLVINPTGSATDKETAFPQFKTELTLFDKKKE